MIKIPKINLLSLKRQATESAYLIIPFMLQKKKIKVCFRWYLNKETLVGWKLIKLVTIGGRMGIG